MTKIRAKVRAAYKGFAYRVLDTFDGMHAEMTRRAWYTPGASAAKRWLRTLSVSAPTCGELDGQKIVSVVVHDGVVLSGPDEKAQWTTIPVRVARMRRIARCAGIDLTQFTSAHCALLDNIINRYVAEFCAYPYQSLRTMNLLPGDVFIDIGAFRGYVAVKAARRVGPHGKVYAIEPIEENFKFIQHHRDANKLENIVALKAAVTPESDASTVEFFRTQNQGNGCIPDHLRGEAKAIEVANLGARSLLEQVRIDVPNARRIVCSLTTNGTEIAVADALMNAFDSVEARGRFEIIIPIIFTAREARDFALRFASRGWCSDFQHPWARFWRRSGSEL